MNQRFLSLFAASILFAAIPARGQEAVCVLFSHLEAADGHNVTVSGDLIISKELAILGAPDCDNRYSSRIGGHGVLYLWPTALSLRPSSDLTPEQARQFQDAGAKADRLRREGKAVSASGSFSGRIQLVSSGGSPAELIFDSFEQLKVEALPDASTLPVIPICDLFQNLSAWKGKRIAVRGEFVSTMEGMWISGGHCKGGFVTNRYRWPVLLAFGQPAYYSNETAKLYEAKWPVPAAVNEFKGDFSGGGETATFVGLLRMRSEYTAACMANGRYMGNGFGHLNGAAAELIVESVREAKPTQPTANDSEDVSAEQRCVP